MGNIEKRSNQTNEEIVKRVYEIRIREMREAVNFIPTSKYEKIGLTEIERRRMGLFVNTGLLPDEIAKREMIKEKTVWNSLNVAIRKIMESEGYEEEEQREWDLIRSLGL